MIFFLIFFLSPRSIKINLHKIIEEPVSRRYTLQILILEDFYQYVELKLEKQGFND